MFGAAIRNHFIGFGSMGIGASICQGIINQNQDMIVYNKNRVRKVRWTNQNIRDRTFNSSMVLAFGGLGALATGHVLWLVPGAIMVGMNLDGFGDDMFEFEYHNKYD